MESLADSKELSYWAADVGIIKIKPAYQVDFGFLFNCQYEKIKSDVFRTFLEDYCSEISEAYLGEEIRTWSHNDEKPEWKGLYRTTYEDGIFTYGVSYNEYNARRANFISEFFLDLIPEIKEEQIFQDSWHEL